MMLMEDCLRAGSTRDALSEIQKVGGTYHTNRFDLGFTIIKKTAGDPKRHISEIQTRRYFFDETVIDMDGAHRESFMARGVVNVLDDGEVVVEQGNLVIHNILALGEQFPKRGSVYVGKRVTDEMLLALEAKGQQIRNPFSGSKSV